MGFLISWDRWGWGRKEESRGRRPSIYNNFPLLHSPQESLEHLSIFWRGISLPPKFPSSCSTHWIYLFLGRAGYLVFTPHLISNRRLTYSSSALIFDFNLGGENSIFDFFGWRWLFRPLLFSGGVFRLHPHLLCCWEFRKGVIIFWVVDNF